MTKLTVMMLSAVLAFALNTFAMDESLGQSQAKKPERAALETAYRLTQTKCTSCHDSVADPAAPGKTRDEWYIIIKLMHDYGLEVTDEEASALVDYLFTIREGVENQPG